jgi:hypothetical protein
MGYLATGEIWIPKEEWQVFVMKYLPESPAETTLGPVAFVDGDMVIQFAQNTECHPAHQSEDSKPEWLKQ